MRTLLFLAALAALSAPCRAEPAADALRRDAAAIRALQLAPTGRTDVVRVPMARGRKSVSKRVGGGMVEIAYADGTVERKPLRRVAQPAAVTDRMGELVARKALVDAALAAADVPADAGAKARAAAMDAAAREARRGGSDLGNALKAVGLLAAGAAGGAAAGKGKKGTP